MITKYHSKTTVEFNHFIYLFFVLFKTSRVILFSFIVYYFNHIIMVKKLK